MNEHYLHVFTEAAWTASIVPMGHEPTFFAMLSFGGFPMFPAWMLAVLGATLGQALNFAIGQSLNRLQKKDQLHISPYWYERVQKLFNKYGLFVLLFSWAPLCNFVTVAAGMLGTRMKYAASLIILGQAIHYWVYLV